MKNIAWIIGLGLMVSLLSCEKDETEKYQTFIKGSWEGTERIDAQPDTLSVLKYRFDETGKAILIICKINALKVSGLDTISINTGTYSIDGNKLNAKTTYVTSGNTRESMLQADIITLNSDAMVLETTDGLKRSRISTFKKVQ